MTYSLFFPKNANKLSNKTCFSYVKNPFSIFPTPCVAKVKDRQCKNNAKYISWLGEYCHAHCPQIIKEIDKVRENNIEEKINSARTDVSKYINNTYQELTPFRITPPPEQWASLFISIIQNQRCFMCDEKDDLIEDHCHLSGMVRAKLCKSCNTKEAVSDGFHWKTYREQAPANGWYYRYFGYGQQLHPSEPDPLENRIPTVLFNNRMAKFFNVKPEHYVLHGLIQNITKDLLIDMYKQIT
jgi:hypothetical protein